MTTSTLVDSNIFIDVLSESPFFEVSRDALFRCMLQGTPVLSAVVWAELARGVSAEVPLRSRLHGLGLRETDFPLEAAFVACQARRRYHAYAGRPERTLPDLLIGAHAMVAGHRLLTRDPWRYRSSFPDLDIVAPDARL